MAIIDISIVLRNSVPFCVKVSWRPPNCATTATDALGAVPLKAVAWIPIGRAASGSGLDRASRSTADVPAVVSVSRTSALPLGAT